MQIGLSSDCGELYRKASAYRIVSVYTQKDSTDSFFYFYIPGDKVYRMSFQDKSMRELILDIFSDKKIAKIIFDAKNYFKFFLNINCKVYSIFCIKLAAQIVTGGLNIFGENISQKTIWDFFVATDYDETNPIENAVNTYKLYQLLNNALLDLNLMETAKLEFKVARVLASMENNGVFVNKTKLLYLKASYETTLEALEDYIKSILGSININSPEQVKEALNKNLGIKLAATDANTLQKFVSFSPVIEKIISYRKISYLSSSVSSNLIDGIDSNGRIHPTFCQNSSATGRIIAINPSVQNIPNQEQIKDCFCAPEGREIIHLDYRQMEALIIAEVSKDLNLIKIIKAGDDIHKITAAHILNKNPEDITDEERNKAKGAFYGLSYSMGVTGYINKCQKDFGIALEYDEAKNIINNFFNFYTGINKWHKEVKNKDIYTLDARSLGNRARFFKESASLTEFLNHQIQGSGADIIKKALVNIYKAFPENVYITNAIHDAISIECDHNVVRDVEKEVMDKMAAAAKKYIGFLKDVPSEWIVSNK